MIPDFSNLERNLFRNINYVVEPAVRRGLGSLRLAPASLIVLETVGFKSGRQRRTPLWSLRVGPYRIISTVRGERSFWVKNLQKQSKVSYYLGGRQRNSEALVVAPGATNGKTSSQPLVLRQLTRLFERYARNGWAFAVLLPARD